MIKLIEKKQDKVVFSVSGINESIANAIRRSVLEIPSLAIDEVEIVKNDSALFDEILAHRIGLLPLKADKTLTLREECDCKGKGCSKCSVSFKLKSKGPCTVYSGELKGKTAEQAFDKMPIVILTKDQELELSAVARLGAGKEHAKFSPGIIFYRPIAEISIGKNCELCEECIKSCPFKLISNEGKKIVIKNTEKCDLCEACVEACRKKGKKCVEIKPNNEEFIFTIESFGQLSPKEIFIGAVKVLDNNLKELDKQVEKL